jgi:titin
VSGYKVSVSRNASGVWSAPTIYTVTGATTLKYNVTSLLNGTQYRFTVAAINAQGLGSYYDPAVVATPRTVPGAPTGVTGAGGESKVTLSWTAPSSTGGAPVLDYYIEYLITGNNNSRQVFSPNPTGTTAVIEGLTNGTSYTFQVKSRNEAGLSGFTTGFGTPTSTPGLPSGLTATPGNSSIAFSWQPPTFTGGTTVTGYEVTYSDSLDGPWESSTIGLTTSHTVTGLTNGVPYYLRVAAKNSAGTGEPAILPNSVTPRTVPDAPTGIIGIPDNGKVTVSWNAPLESGGSDVTGYIVQFSSNAGTTWLADSSVILSPNTSHVVTGLTNGVEYHMRVRARNAAGDSAQSIPAGPYKPRTTPSQPGAVTGTASDTTVTLSWAAPSSNGGAEITDYIVEYTSDNGVTTPVFTDGTRATTGAQVTGLTNGTAYKFRVKAVNEASISGGTATNWSAAITPYTTPGTPSAPSGTAGNEQVLLTWTAPGNGGSAITSYVVDYSANEGATWASVTTSSSPSHTVTGLQNGYSYIFRVTAQNAAGPGSVSAVSQAVTPRTVPVTPAAPTATPDNASALVSWSAPSDGGSVITDYEVQFSFNNGSSQNDFSDSVSTDNSTTVTGLTNGTKYVFRVRALNAAGSSLWSAWSSLVTPYTTPGAPGKPTGTAKDASVTLTWTAAVNNGSTVSNHVVEYSVAGSNDWSDGGSSGSLTTHTVTGLQNGTQYAFRVKAANAAGSGPLSLESDAVKPFGKPGKPTALQVVPGNGTLDLSWSSPSDDGGSPVSDYVLQFSMYNGLTWSTWALFTDPNNSTLTQHTLTGLINGSSYKLRVAAKNAAGVGEWSDESDAVKPRTSPLRPGKPVADPASEQIGLVWTAPSSDGGSDITDYRVQYGVYPVLLETDWQIFQDGTSAALSAVVTGLQNGTQYQFRVAAENAAGWSDYSLPSSITAPYTTPGAPSKPAGVSGSKQVTLNWTANADNGGDEVSDFKIQFKIASNNNNNYNPANTDTWSDFTDEESSAAGALVTGLTDGTQYVFRVAAKNAAGDSEWSVSSDPVTPYSKTSPPTWSTGSAADASVTIAWQEPSDLGGGSVLGYTLRYSSSAPSCDNGAWVTVFEDQLLLTKTVTGLTNGANYRFCVAAKNEAGLSLWSDVSSLYMPVTAPGQVVSPITKIAPSSVEVSWTKPVSDGGSLITKYQVEHAESGEAWPDTPIEVLASAPLKTLVSGLENGTEYKFRIRAISNYDSGPWSAVLLATPYTNPDAPTDLLLFARALEIEASWVPPVVDGGMPVTKYKVMYKPSLASAWFSFETTGTTYTIPNLTRNTSYDVQIIALNPLESGPLSDTVVTAAAFAPDAPTITSVERGYRFLTVTFLTPASDGGADITKYQYSTNNGAHYRDVIGSSAATTTFVIDKLSVNGAALLDNTDYQVKIRAYNAAKLTGAASVTVTQKTAGRPGVLFPVLSQAQPDNVSMHFTWSAIDPQGTAVTDYEYSTDDGVTWNVATTATSGTDVSSTVTLTSNTDITVANGTWYKVKWRAKNLVGYSDASIAYDVRPRTIPDAPTLDSSSGQNQRATLNVSQAVWDGGAPVENYEYRYRATNVAAWGPWVAFDPKTIADTLTITGLGINISYDFQVRTVNEAGPSLASNTGPLLTHDYPGAPSLDSYIPANNQITALFSIPDYNGRTPVLNYQYSLDGSTFADFTPQNLVINPDGSESGRLVFASPSGQWRTLKMRTINDVGPSPDSNVMSVIAAYPPSAPRSFVVSRNLASLSLSWQEPSDLGFVPILDHEYSFDNGSSWNSLNTTSISSTITGLAHCTSYTVIIRAVNVAGNGAQSTPASNSTFCKPSTPAAPGVSASERKVTVSWTAPANGGTSITGYAIQRSTNGGASWSQVTSNTNSTATSFTDNASNNTAYVYRVAAINAVDTGTYSGASVAVTPVVPAPSGVTKGTVTASEASFSWNASGSAYLASSNRYRVYRGSTYLGATNDTTYTATGLSENTAYTFYVYAVDNLDTWSSAASASITSGNTPIWADSASAANNGAYYSAWSGDSTAARRSINWALNPADGQNYSRTDVYVREYSYGCYCWGSWGLVGTAYGSEAGVSGSFTQGGHVAVRPSYSYQTLLRVWDTYGGSNDYVYETATHGLDYRSVYKNRVGYVNNSANEITEWTGCSAQSTHGPNGAWASCSEAFDRDTESGWMSGDLGCGTSCNSTHTNWIVMDTGDTRHYLGKSAYEKGYPQSPGSATPSYTLTSVKIYMHLCHNVKIEIDYSGGNDPEDYYAPTATGPTQYCAGWHDVNLTDRGVRVTSDSDAFWSAKLTIGNPRTYCCSGYSRRVRVAEIQFGVSYWYDADSEFR